MDVYSLLSIVKSYYRPDNYDLHIKLCMVSKKYYEFTKDLEIDQYFDVKVNDAIGIFLNSSNRIVTHKVCGVLHRLYGPARIEYYKNGEIKCETYYINGKYRKNKPTSICYDSSCSVKYDIYFDDNGEYHRENGPAYVLSS